MMSRFASRARQKILRLIDRGEAPLAAWEATLKTYPAETGAKSGHTLARYSDGSYLELLFDKEPIVRSHRQATAWMDRAIDGIALHCDECGKEIWCAFYKRPENMVRGDPQETFEIAGATAHICKDCQRELVVRALVGE